jgi:SAM-dependent methyltransferase
MESPPTRITIASALQGEGIEIGAGHWPFPVPVGVTGITYVSRHSPEDERRLFPEVSVEHDFGRVDVIADMDADGLTLFSDNSQDFVIASHVLEHLAAPIWAISEFIRVVRPDGYIVLVLPDRRFTFDSNRDPTSLEHVKREYVDAVREVDDLHIREFLAKTGGGMNPSAAELALHRERSIHAHCWTESEFDELLNELIVNCGFSFAVEETYGPAAPNGTGIEFAYRLRVTSDAEKPRLIGKIADDGINSDSVEADLLSELARENVSLQNELDSVYGSRTWRLGALPRALKRAFE